MSTVEFVCLFALFYVFAWLLLLLLLLLAAQVLARSSLGIEFAFCFLAKCATWQATLCKKCWALHFASFFSVFSYVSRISHRLLRCFCRLSTFCTCQLRLPFVFQLCAGVGGDGGVMTMVLDCFVATLPAILLSSIDCSCLLHSTGVRIFSKNSLTLSLCIPSDPKHLKFKVICWRTQKTQAYIHIRHTSTNFAVMQ